MTDTESKLKLNYLSNIIKYSKTINPTLNNIYKEEYYSKLLENNNKKIIIIRCKNPKCNKIFLDSKDYEIDINIKKQNRKKLLITKIKCNACNKYFEISSNIL